MIGSLLLLVSMAALVWSQGSPAGRGVGPLSVQRPPEGAGGGAGRLLTHPPRGQRGRGQNGSRLAEWSGRGMPIKLTGHS